MAKANKLNITLDIAGDYSENQLQHRGYYISGNRRVWPGPPRNDKDAAYIDVLPFRLQGYATGVESAPTGHWG